MESCNIAMLRPHNLSGVAMLRTNHFGEESVKSIARFSDSSEQAAVVRNAQRLQCIPKALTNYDNASHTRSSASPFVPSSDWKHDIHFGHFDTIRAVRHLKSNSIVMNESGAARMKMYSHLAPLLFVSMGSAANAAPVCDLNAAQALFGRPSRDDAAIKPLLQVCLDAGSTDYRTYMFLGVIARDRHEMNDAATLLQKAHDLAPQEPAPALELALTHEWRNEPEAARALYQSVLAANPASRPAHLGLARVDRSQYRFEEAAEIYRALLQVDPQDVDARNGLAAIALANRQLDIARAEFQAVLKDAPDNGEAQAGLAGSDRTWRYQLDVTGGAIHSNMGTAGSAGIDLLTYLGATDALDVGWLHYTDELPSAQLTQQTLLPSDDLRIGYYRIVASDYHWAVTYDYRNHDGLPSEHWLQGNVGSYFAGGLQWFFEVRESFGAAQWNNQLVHAGLMVPITGYWDVVGSGYFANLQNNFPGITTRSYSQNYAVNVDIERQGPGDSFFLVGAGYSPDIDNTDVHARLILPVIDRGAILFSVEHISINNESQITAGWRFFLQ